MRTATATWCPMLTEADREFLAYLDGLPVRDGEALGMIATRAAGGSRSASEAGVDGL